MDTTQKKPVKLSTITPAQFAKSGTQAEFQVDARLPASDLTSRTISDNGGNSFDLRGLIPDLIFRVNRQGVFMDYKAEVSDLHVQSDDNIIGKRYRDITPPYFADLIDAKIRTALDTGMLQIFDYQLPIPGRGMREYEARMAVSGANDVTAFVRDITERKKVEEELRKSELRYRSIVEMSTDIIYRIEPAGIVTYASPSVLQTIKYMVNEIVGKHFLEFIHPDDHSVAIAAYQGLLRGEDIRSLDLRIMKNGGGFIYGELNIAPLMRDNAVYEVQGVIHDVTKRKRADEIIQESERFVTATLDSLSAHIAVLDEAGSIVAVNHAWRAFYEANSPEACNGDAYTGVNYLSVCENSHGPGSEEGQAMAAGIRVVMSMEQKEFSIEYPCHSPNEKRWFTARVTRFSGEDAPMIVVAHEVITERKQAEDALQAKEAFLKVLLNAIPAPVFYKDRAGRYLGFNSAFETFFGKTQEELLGKSVFDINPPELAKIYHAKDAELFDSGGTQQYEARVKTTDDTPRDVIFNKSVFTDSQGTIGGLIGVVLDITERKQVEKTISQLNASLEKRVQERTAELGATIDMLHKEITVRNNVEEDLRESEDRYRRIVRTVTDYIYTVKIKNGRATETTHSNACLDVTGYSKKEFADDPYLWFNMVFAEDRALVSGQISELRSGSAAPPVVEHRIVRKDGTQRWVRSTCVPNYDYKGSLQSYDGLIQDITVRKRAEAEIISTKLMLEASLSSMTDAVFISDTEGRFIIYNEAFATFHKFRNKEECSRTLAEYPAFMEVWTLDCQLVPLEQWAVPRALRGETNTNVEFFLRRKDTGETWVGNYSFAPVRDKVGAIVGSVVTARDISMRKQMEQRDLNRSRILESITTGAPLAAILELIAKSVEAEDPASLCSILLLDNEGKHLLLGAAPSLPDFYNQAINGLEIRDGVGSCGTAAATKQSAIAEDVLTHPHWADSRELTQQANLRSCWSEPILSFDGKVLGTVAIYHREPRVPGQEDISRIKAATDLSCIAIERKLAETALMLERDHLEEVVKTRTMELEKEISVRKLAEETLLQVNDRMYMAVRAGSVGLWDYDVVKNQLSWDEQMFRLYGMTRDQFSGAYDAWQAGLHPDDRQRGDDEIQQALRGEKEFDTEFRVVWPDGSIHNIRALALIQRDASGNPLHMFGTNWDITAQKQAEASIVLQTMKVQNANEELTLLNTELSLRREEAEDLKRQADEANKAKSDFLANMSHELRTPLTAIIGFSEIMHDDLCGTVSGEQKEFLLNILTSGRHLLQLINDILDLSKVEAGKMTLEPAEMSVQDVLQGSLMMLKEKAMKHQIKLRAEIAPDLGTIIADELKIKQVVFNLLSNAVKFTLDGGSVMLEARRMQSSKCKVQSEMMNNAELDADFIEISVIDTGIGIKAKDMGKLFRPFQQINSELSQKRQGTGLGLNLSKKFVELHGGRIRAESEYGKGSRFIFEIPVKQ